MSLRDYLLDRLPLLAAFTVATGFLIIVSQLLGGTMRLVDAGYVLLLAAVFTALILTADYWRQRQFRRGLTEEMGGAGEGRAARPLPRPVTREQAALLELAAVRQSLCEEELVEYRAASRQHRAFIDHWVHQMKTPLSVIELTVQQELEGGDQGSVDAAHESWQSVAEEAQLVADGLDLVLAAARLEGFELDLRPARVDLTELCRRVVNDLRRAWIRSGVYPRMVIDEEVTVETDPKWFEVVLLQLLGNAIKYTTVKPAGARNVTLSAERQGDDVVLIVDDSGIGIPEHDLPRVFDRFFTGDNGRLTKASTGMGLYLVAEVCKRLGHPLEVRSTAGEGTTVLVRFSTRTLH